MSHFTEDQIKHMVNRFLGWRLPKNFNPDAGISYTRPNYAPSVDATPSGTNLFDATQADAMVRYMIEGLPIPSTLAAAIKRALERGEGYVRAATWKEISEPPYERGRAHKDLAEVHAALCMAINGPAQPPLQGIYDAINALGGRPDQDNCYDQGIVDTVAKVLDIIEKAQAAGVAQAPLDCDTLASAIYSADDLYLSPDQSRRAAEAAIRFFGGAQASAPDPLKAMGLPWEDVAEDDPDVILAAHAIAEHGIGRQWDDFLPTNAYDVDQGDLIEYARAAVAALRAKVSPVPSTHEAPVNLPFERLPQHAGDPAFGPVPNVVPLGSSDPNHPSNTPADAVVSSNHQGDSDA
ncbi:hypothetical protein SAMN05444159_1320 [Bradyrhizobium lablabi]|uniref:Uncharacterized protein n=1 Tax=Bradyrhizobium lablabi TaxID=722472 RepID=A0A1M6LLZ6_9BRAD|nr:hypothetical protein [Bradyrhizobium lablabi]SHJ72246.1 hypothetical protein SAMN05444159_1320 [Bradyrhizobium lablabi]